MFLCMDWAWGKLPAGSSTYTSHLQYTVSVFQMRGLHCKYCTTQKNCIDSASKHIVSNFIKCVCVCVWVSEWVSECECVCVCVSEWVRVCVWVSESVCVWVSEWVCEWVSVCVCVCVCGVCVCVCVCEWVSEWVSVWVSEWVSECVCLSFKVFRLGWSQLNDQKRITISTCSSWKLFMLLILTWLTEHTPQNSFRSLNSQRYVCVCDAYDICRVWCCCILFISASYLWKIIGSWWIPASFIHMQAAVVMGNRGTTFSCSIFRHTLIYQRELDPAISRRTWSNCRCVHKQLSSHYTDHAHSVIL